ncbi:MAG: ABC transporter substrate-binding protein, partial [Ramlibacter sp.]
RGYYAAEGIDLTIVRGQGSGDTAVKIDLKQAQFGIADTPTAITAISKGAEIVIVGMVFDKAANNMFFYKDANIRSPKDLVGKSVAIPPGDSHRTLWPAFARANKIDPDSITIVNVKPEGKPTIVAAKRVDASFDLVTGFPLYEKALGKGQVGNLLWADWGLELYGLSYIVHKDLVKSNPDLIRRFLRATYKGWSDMAAKPQEGIDTMLAEVAGLDREVYMEMSRYVLQLVVTDRARQNGLGWIVPDVMQKTVDLTYAGGAMGKAVPADQVYTNAFNPKVIPGK